MSDKKALSIGAEFFDDLRREDCYYVDKTWAIAELLRKKTSVTLFTRPRRFGKTLFMTTLKSFFEIGADSELFDGLAISRERELCEKYLGKHPVIFLTLKGIEGKDYAEIRERLIGAVRELITKYSFLKNSDLLNEDEKENIRELLNPKLSDTALLGSLKTLSSALADHFGTKTVILIDEYDVPLDSAFRNDCYDEVVSLLRGLLGNALKTNESLELAVLTGCLRIAKESIFTGFNNFKVWTLTDEYFSDCFGFTDDEVRELLSYYDRDELYTSAKEWYDGYLFGTTQMYCPWDVVNYVSDNCGSVHTKPKNYWTNTSGNDLLIKFIGDMGMDTPDQIEDLISGKSVKVAISQELTYRDLETSRDNIWSVLYMTGYLTVSKPPEDEVYELIIPNREVRQLIVTQIIELFHKSVRRDTDGSSLMAQAFMDGDSETVESLFNDCLKRSISIRDTSIKREMKENFYHGYLLGILQSARKNGQHYSVRSNREGGDGYADITIREQNGDTGVIIEVKYAEDDRLDYWADKALLQIEAMKYAEYFDENEVSTVLKYGIACYKKKCRVLCF